MRQGLVETSAAFPGVQPIEVQGDHVDFGSAANQASRSLAFTSTLLPKLPRPEHPGAAQLVEAVNREGAALGEQRCVRTREPATSSLLRLMKQRVDAPHRTVGPRGTPPMQFRPDTRTPGACFPDLPPYSA